jgi:hypothetical protein
LFGEHHLGDPLTAGQVKQRPPLFRGQVNMLGAAIHTASHQAVDIGDQETGSGTIKG